MNLYIVNLLGTSLDKQIFQKVVHISYRIFCTIKHMGETWQLFIRNGFFGEGQEKGKLHEIKDGHGDGAMLVISYPSPNWVNMNICTSRASLGNKNKMYIVEVNRPSYCTTFSSQAQHLIYCYAYQI